MRTTCAILVVLAACDPSGRGDDDDGGPGSATRVELTQAIGGAMFANPDAYAAIPVHAIVEGDPRAVTIAVDGVATDAILAGGVWTADVAIAALADGTHELVASSHGVETAATLVVGRQGIQWTSIAADGNAATPRLHRGGDRLFLTWTAGTTTRNALVQELDGAGRPLGERVTLIGGSEDTLYARTAFGSKGVGIVFQRRGGPYQSFFTIVGFDGRELLAPIALDPADRFGSHGGDIVYTGSGFDVVFRTNNGMGASDVRWLHVDETTHAVTGPIIAAAKGNSDPDGGFDPITNVSIAHHEGASLIAFSRYRYDAQLELELLKCQLATITGGVATTEVVDGGGGFHWDDDCRILSDGTAPVVVRSAKDLESTDDNPPDTMFAARLPLAGSNAPIVTGPETRVEPALIGTAASPVLAWSDARSYAVDLTQGEVELYAAVLGPDLVSGTHVRFAHSHFIEGTSDLRGVAAGTNAILTWIDERHGGSVVDPRPEVYLETVWQ